MELKAAVSESINRHKSYPIDKQSQNTINLSDENYVTKIVNKKSRERAPSTPYSTKIKWFSVIKMQFKIFINKVFNN